MGNLRISDLPTLKYASPEDLLLITTQRPREYGIAITETRSITLTDLFALFQKGASGNICKYCQSIGSLNENNICMSCGAPKMV